MSHLLGVGGSSLVRDLVFNGCEALGELVEEGFVRVSEGVAVLTGAGRVACLRGLEERGRWWLVGRVGVEVGCPFISCGGVVVAPFSWLLWREAGEGFVEAYIVRGVRRCARRWMGAYGARPYWDLRRAGELVRRALDVYGAGGNVVYAWRLLEEAEEKLMASCRMFGVRCRVEGGVLSSRAARLLGLVEELMSVQRRRGSSSQSCL